MISCLQHGEYGLSMETAAQPDSAGLGMVEVSIDGVCGEDEDNPPVVRELLRGQLVEQGGLVALKQSDAFPAVQAQHLVRLHEIPLGVAAGLGVGPGAGVDWGEQWHEGHLVMLTGL